MKTLVKKILHTLLGFRNYLFVFAKYKIRTLKKDKQENDFFKFLELIENPEMVLDVGANIGVMTYYLSTRFPESKILAFEPVPHNIATLKRVIGKYNLTNVTVHETALSNEVGTATMILPVVSRVKMHGLSHVKHRSITEYNDGEEFEVQTNTLDSLLANRTKKVSAIKMDVENFECFVLEGSKQVLQSDRPIVYTELWENENRDKCLTLMAQLGFSCNVVHNGQLETYRTEVHNTQNFIFIPQ